MKEKLLYQPLFVRLFHWAFVITIVILMFTGFYITSPFPMVIFVGITLRTVRFIHLIAASVSVALVAARLYYAFVSGDYKFFLITRRGLKTIPQLVRYYLFLDKVAPPTLPKYNIGQIFIILSWYVGIGIETFTGVILANLQGTDYFLRLFGGMQMVRFIHFIVAIWFLSTTLIHFYLVMTSDPAKLQAMFSGYLNRPQNKESDI